ncbi:MAG: twin-arginine translocase TatA/TatE family subunit [Actinomycetota bacterium]
MPQGWEWIIIGGALFLLFGASRLPQLAKSLGQSRKAFKDGMREAEEEAEIEEKQRQLNPKAATAQVAAPQISALTDEEIMTEMRRRAEMKQS